MGVRLCASIPRWCISFLVAIFEALLFAPFALSRFAPRILVLDEKQVEQARTLLKDTVEGAAKVLSEAALVQTNATEAATQARVLWHTIAARNGCNTCIAKARPNH